MGEEGDDEEEVSDDDDDDDDNSDEEIEMSDDDEEEDGEDGQNNVSTKSKPLPPGKQARIPAKPLPPGKQARVPVKPLPAGKQARIPGEISSDDEDSSDVGNERNKEVESHHAGATTALDYISEDSEEDEEEFNLKTKKKLKLLIQRLQKRQQIKINESGIKSVLYLMMMIVEKTVTISTCILIKKIVGN